MLFNSVDFLIFFPIVVGIYFLLPYRWRWFWLLLSSCYFYMAFVPVYILVLFATIVVDYLAGILIDRSVGKIKKVYLIGSIIFTCLILFVFKYFNFFNANLDALGNFLGWNYPINYLSIILPIGLSFHTFQSLSYVIEVYRGNQRAEHRFGIYALYVMFFPQLVAGPIERPQNLLHQFDEYHHFDYVRISRGLKRMLWGFFKKIVIADRLALVANTVFSDAYDYSGLSLIIAVLFFAFQIYCDFSGYSDIALGAAQVMGFKLMENFKRPYFSRSIHEFWQRWHISLSSWFKDYVYIPLGGSRVLTLRRYANLFIVFILSGFWHGASWTFIVWGALHGVYLILGIITRPLKDKFFYITSLIRFPKIIKFLEIICTFILVSISWVFFRANNIDEAFYILTHLFSNLSFDIPSLNIGLGYAGFIYCLAIVVFMESISLLQERGGITEFLDNKPLWVRWSVYIVLLWMILFLGIFKNQQFIYFQF